VAGTFNTTVDSSATVIEKPFRWTTATDRPEAGGATSTELAAADGLTW